jgi:uncharacterized protein
VVVKGRDVFSAEMFGTLTDLSDKFSRIEGVDRVIGLPSVRRAMDVGEKWPLERIAALMRPVPLFEGHLFSADHRFAALTLVLQPTAEPEVVVDAVQRTIDGTRMGTQVFQTGMPVVSRALETFTRRDFFLLPPFAFLLIAAILWGLFQRLGLTLLPLLCIVVALVWTFGIMVLLGIHLSVLTMIVPVLLIAVGTAYCMHIIAEYRLWEGCGQDAVGVVMETYARIAFPTFLAVATTMVGPASLFVSRIPMIREFALCAIIGMASLLGLMSTLLPSLLTLHSAPNLSSAGEAEPGRGRLAGFMSTVVHWVLNHQRSTLIGFALVGVWCLMGLFQLKVETSPMRYFKADNAVRRDFKEICSNLCGAFPVHLVVQSDQADFFEDPARLHLVEKTQRYLETLPGVDRSFSLVDYLKLIYYAANGFDTAYYRLPREAWELRMLYNNFKIILGEDLLRHLVSRDLRTANITMLTSLSSSSDFIRLRRNILDHLDETLPEHLQREITGFSVVISASSELVARGQVKSLALTMAAVFLIMFILFLSTKIGLIAIVPNFFPILVNFGVMGWLGIELSMFTSLIASIAIGLAVDDTIHYLVRYNREFRQDLDERRALDETLHHIGRPILYTSLTLAVGFSVLIFSSFQPTSVFGLMMVVTIVSALAGDLLLLPVLMRQVQIVTLWDLVRIKLGTEPRKGLPIFRGLSHAEVHYIIVAGALRQLAPGETLFRRGEPSDSMYVVVTGALEVLDHPANVDPTEGGHAAISQLGNLHAGDLVGEMGLLRNMPRTATVIALRPSELLQINMNMIRRLQWLYPPTAQRFFLNLMTQLCDRIDRISRCFDDGCLPSPLAGLCTRDIFLRVLGRHMRRCDGDGDDPALCLMQIADGSGWGEPPETSEPGARRIAFLQRLPRLVRQSDIVGLIDAKTIGVVMPRVTAGEARLFCRRARKAARESRLPLQLQMVGPGETPHRSAEDFLREVRSRLPSD